MMAVTSPGAKYPVMPSKISCPSSVFQEISWKVRYADSGPSEDWFRPPCPSFPKNAKLLLILLRMSVRNSALVPDTMQTLATSFLFSPNNYVAPNPKIQNLSKV
jgi:hypothetical protein